VNGADGIFENFTKTISKSFVWIHFHNPHIRHNIWIIIYDEFRKLDKQWRPIEHKIVEIQIGSNPSHIITRIQFPIQLIATLGLLPNFWKFYLMRTDFTLDEPFSLVKVFRLFRLELIFLVFRVWTQ
jgi:hypothetical protein